MTMLSHQIRHDAAKRLMAGMSPIYQYSELQLKSALVEWKNPA
jgi:hypothetical protein